jgi:hypothetical protein
VQYSNIGKTIWVACGLLLLLCSGITLAFMLKRVFLYISIGGKNTAKYK